MSYLEICDAVGGASVKIGNVVQARVLDIVKSDGIVDLTLRPELMQHSKLEESKQKPLTKKVCILTFLIDFVSIFKVYMPE